MSYNENYAGECIDEHIKKKEIMAGLL